MEHSLLGTSVPSTTCCGRSRLRALGRLLRSIVLSASNQMKEVRRNLERWGFTATKTRGGHWRIEHPKMDGPVFAPDTPSDHRGLKNLRAMLRRKMRMATVH
jgi:predicted RNA binding protein YcfA (HicA-like mRNA interferase family)